MTDNDLRTTRRVRELKGEQRQSTPQQVLCTNLPLCPFPLPLSPVHVQSFNHSPCPFPPLPLSTRPSRGGCKCTCCNRPPTLLLLTISPPSRLCLSPPLYQASLSRPQSPSLWRRPLFPSPLHPSICLSIHSFFLFFYSYFGQQQRPDNRTKRSASVPA